MINICLGHTFSGNGCDFISKDIFQLIAGNERASFLTNEEGRNFGSSPWGAIIIEARFFVVHVGGKNWPFDIFDWSCADHTAWLGEWENALGKAAL